MIKSLAHVCFVVPDLDRSIAFYRDKLGLRLAFDFINEKGERFGVYLHVAGRSFVELFQSKLADRAPGQSYQHLCLEVDDLNATVADLRAKGLEVTDPFYGSDNSWQAWVKDPDGNSIELHYYTPQSKQLPALK